MSSVEHFVGLDYHQNSVQVCVMDRDARVRMNRSGPNDAAWLVSTLREVGPVKRIALEACCGAADFADALADAGADPGEPGGGGWRVELAHAGYVAKLKGSPDKTDYSDAKLLADLSRVGYLPRVWHAPAAIRELRALVRHRQRVVDDRRDAKLQVTALMREQRLKVQGQGSRWTKAWVAAVREHSGWSSQARWIVGDLLDDIERLQAKVRRVETRLEEATRDDPVVRRLRERVEGVGPVTAWSLRASIGRFDRFRNGKQLARYCGLSPRNASSGGRQADAGLIHAADPRLRATLIQATHLLVRRDPRWSKLFQRLVARGKPRCLAIAAVANRWVRSMHHRMIDLETQDTRPE